MRHHHHHPRCMMCFFGSDKFEFTFHSMQTHEIVQRARLNESVSKVVGGTQNYSPLGWMMELLTSPVERMYPKIGTPH